MPPREKATVSQESLSYNSQTTGDVHLGQASSLLSAGNPTPVSSIDPGSTGSPTGQSYDSFRLGDERTSPLAGDGSGSGTGSGAGTHAPDGRLSPENVPRRRVSVSFNETKAARRRRILNLVRVRGLRCLDLLRKYSTVKCSTIQCRYSTVRQQ